MKKLVLLLLMCMVGVAAGQEAVATNETIITSDRLEYDFPRALALFTGNVLVRDKDMKMWADKMTVILTPRDEIESVTAIGRVRIIQPDRKARCRKAIFLMDKNEVILTGDAVIEQGQDRVEGRVIHIWTDSDRMVSEPGHLVIFSKDQEPEDPPPLKLRRAGGGRRTEVGGRKSEGGSRKTEAGGRESGEPISDL
ncbi:MAG: LptA/OstA family protein [Kiritimatiellae bacterium]|nr:LptA/OstA family protein [Kiritimatiellia bacterium]